MEYSILEKLEQLLNIFDPQKQESYNLTAFFVNLFHIHMHLCQVK